MSKKSKVKVGRPTVMTPEVIAKLEQAFAIDCSVLEACSYADIGTNSFYDYLKINPLFSNRIEQLRQRPVLAARQRAVKGVNESYINAMDYLKRKRRLEFSEQKDITAQPQNINILISGEASGRFTLSSNAPMTNEPNTLTGADSERPA